MLIHNALYIALEPGRAERAVVASNAASPGAVRTEGLVVLPAASTAFASSPTLVTSPRYRVAPLPLFAADPPTAAACVAAAAGTGGWDRATGRECT